jgi:hypothetical protein
MIDKGCSMTEEIPEKGRMKQELATMIDVLDDLSVLQKRFLHSRWLDQVVCMEGKGRFSQRCYFALRVMAIVGGVIVPALVALKFREAPSIGIFAFTFTISLLVAISVTMEEFFRFGERWRYYRRTVELLKSEGWQFFQLAGAYQYYNTHSEVYTAFAARVEEILHRDMDALITQVKEKKEQ